LVTEGKLNLGTWQRMFHAEFDSRRWWRPSRDWAQSKTIAREEIEMGIAKWGLEDALHGRAVRSPGKKAARFLAE
jgi:hypothetical protein